MAIRQKLTYMGAALEITAALLFFTIGGCIYLAFRCTSLRMFGWFDYLGLHEFIIGVRSVSNNIQIPQIIKFCIPDGLWSLSYILFMDAIWNPDMKRQLLFGSLVPIVGVFSELLQYFNVLIGTFDAVDLSCYIAPYVLYLFFKVKL